MVDYYEELLLKKESDIKQIQVELVRLESLWHKREVNSPEKANKMLGLIMDAKKVFASGASRRKYDSDLESSRREPEDPDVSRSKTLEKWTNQAREYYVSRQYDLAKIAVEKAISLSNVHGDDDVLFALAADIYKDNGDLDIAMTYINRAIVAAPEVSAYYISKGLIYDHQASAAMQRSGYGNPANFRSEARKMFQLADAKAEQNGDLANRARACGALAFSYYFQEPMDKVLGEGFANLAVAFGGDSWGNADKVLEEVNAIREEAKWKEWERERTRKEGIYREATRMADSQEISELERAISKFKSISDYKDAFQQAKAIQNIVDAAEREKQAKIKRRKIAIKAILLAMLIAIPIIAVAILVGKIVKNIEHRKCGDDLKWSYSAETKALSITGTGAMYDYPYYMDTPWNMDFLYSRIETVIIEDGCTRIGVNAFSSFEKLTNIEIPDSVTSIGSSAFSGCRNLETIDLPNGLVSIESLAFSECENLKKIDLPNNLVSIAGEDSYNFSPFEASGIRSLYLPASVETVGDIAGGVSNLNEITVDSANSYFTSFEGVLFNKDMSILRAYPPAKSGSSYSVPEGVTEIGSGAFQGADALESIYLPDSVIELGDYAFNSCKSLESINIPEGVTSIGYGAFSWCTLLESIAIPEEVTNIGDDAFAWCTLLKSIDIPGGVTSIGDGAFRFCESLKRISFSEGVTAIDESLFFECNNLTEIVIPLSVYSINREVFSGCPENSVIYYSGTKGQWLSFAGDLDFAGIVECSDERFRY